ncbi:unnamed protein product [Amoebophrya sp. A120]|nr:unnamed protein product [Amoebophrya sp. A120]|eukprot:GSA120T00017375001.1
MLMDTKCDLRAQASCGNSDGVRTTENGYKKKTQVKTATNETPHLRGSGKKIHAPSACASPSLAAVPGGTPTTDTTASPTAGVVVLSPVKSGKSLMTVPLVPSSGHPQPSPLGSKTKTRKNFVAADGAQNELPEAEDMSSFSSPGLWSDQLSGPSVAAYGAEGDVAMQVGAPPSPGGHEGQRATPHEDKEEATFATAHDFLYQDIEPRKRDYEEAHFSAHHVGGTRGDGVKAKLAAEVTRVQFFFDTFTTWGASFWTTVCYFLVFAVGAVSTGLVWTWCVKRQERGKKKEKPPAALPTGGSKPHSTTDDEYESMLRTAGALTSTKAEYVSTSTRP